MMRNMHEHEHEHETQLKLKRMRKHFYQFVDTRVSMYFHWSTLLVECEFRLFSIEYSIFEPKFDTRNSIFGRDISGIWIYLICPAQLCSVGSQQMTTSRFCGRKGGRIDIEPITNHARKAKHNLIFFFIYLRPRQYFLLHFSVMANLLSTVDHNFTLRRLIQFSDKFCFINLPHFLSLTFGAAHSQCSGADKFAKNGRKLQHMLLKIRIRAAALIVSGASQRICEAAVYFAI